MPRFFIRQNQIIDGTVNIVGDDAHHIARSLRMAVGDCVIVCDMQGNEYDCEISSFLDDKEVSLKINKISPPQNEPPCRITLYQALPKADKLDTIIQKAVECGVFEIVPFESERCVVKSKADAEERKRERRARIAAEAAKQCGRSIIPQVSYTLSFEEMLERASSAELPLICYEGDGTVLLGKLLNDFFDSRDNIDFTSISVVIGSEGGFSQKEVALAKEKGMICVGLGRRILRTETASGFALACIACKTELE